MTAQHISLCEFLYGRLRWLQGSCHYPLSHLLRHHYCHHCCNISCNKGHSNCITILLTIYTKSRPPKKLHPNCWVWPISNIHECILCKVFKFQPRQPVIWFFPRSWSSRARAWHLWGIWVICFPICFTLTAIKGRRRTNCIYWQDPIKIKLTFYQIFTNMWIVNCELWIFLRLWSTKQIGQS